MRTRITKIKVNELVEDFDFYPRASVDTMHVGFIAEAIEAGAKIPPVVVEEKTLRIVDGLHRSRAWRRVHGDDSEIECCVKSYKDDQELFLDAMRLNSSHGRHLTQYDRTHALLRAEKLHIDPALVATALNMKVETFQDFRRTHIARVDNLRTFSPLKRPLRHLQGASISKEQAECMPKFGGNTQGFYVAQLLLLIRTDSIDKSDEKLMVKLEELHVELGKLISVVAA